METVHFYQEIHFHNWHRYGFTPVGYRKWHSFGSGQTLTVNGRLVIPPPTALDSTVIVIIIMLQIIFIIIKIYSS